MASDKVPEFVKNPKHIEDFHDKWIDESYVFFDGKFIALGDFQISEKRMVMFNNCIDYLMKKVQKQQEQIEILTNRIKELEN